MTPQYNSEWMRVMLEEIARKRAEEEEMRAEEERRRESQPRFEGDCGTVRASLPTK
jgi:hypothetical protein